MAKKYLGKSPDIDGMLWVDDNDKVWEVGNPKWEGSKVGKSLK